MIMELMEKKTSKVYKILYKLFLYYVKLDFKSAQKKKWFVSFLLLAM